ncbi:glycosyltransferase family 2 protein [Helicobacter ganmani]|uniref:glycosyltransferase family 2 protein n=3 Tax=Helicobacter ganmani TaxID=60246 RepID=UPI003A847F60
MKISIIIPLFNTEKFIARALESCIKQTYSNIEIIVVDDKSEDKSIEIVKQFCQTDERIHLIENDSNLGPFVCRNKGAIYANRGGGQILMFLDSDDTLEKNACEEVALSFQEEIDLCIFQFKRQEGERQYQENSWFNRDLSLNLDEFEKLWIDNGGSNLINSLCNKAFRTEIFIQNFEENLKNIQERLLMAEDAIVSVSYLSCVKKVRLLNQSLYIYYVNENSATQEKTNLSKIALYLQNLLFAINFLKHLPQIPLKSHNVFIGIAVCNLKIHYLDLQKSINKGFFCRLGLKIKRKRVKILKSRLLKSPF